VLLPRFGASFFSRAPLSNDAAVLERIDSVCLPSGAYTFIQSFFIDIPVFAFIREASLAHLCARRASMDSSAFIPKFTPFQAAAFIREYSWFSTILSLRSCFIFLFLSIPDTYPHAATIPLPYFSILCLSSSVLILLPHFDPKAIYILAFDEAEC
jgi:hypothetical protein